MTHPVPPVVDGGNDAGREPLRVLLISTYELGRQPFSLASPAAWLMAGGAVVETLDLAVESFSRDLVRRADLVALSVPMHTATRLALHHLPSVRSANPGAVICCFGLYAAMNEEHLRSAGADFVLAGEYEEGLARIARTVDARRRGAPEPGPPPDTVSTARQNFMVPYRAGLPSLDRYARLVTGEGERLIGSTEATRGCKHRCRHCPIVPVYDGRFRVVQRDVVLADIRQQVAAGATHITFGDPDFFNGPAHSIAVVRALHQEFPQVTYDATIKIEHLVKRDDLIPVLKDTGCLFVTSAVEAFDEPTLEALEKNHLRRDVIRVAQRFREVGLHLSPTFVPFTPWTTTRSYLDLLETVAELDLVGSVAPVQYAIRLLIPRGSRILELPLVRDCIQPFDPASLAFPWVHPDPEVDELHARILDIAGRGAAEGAERQSVFADIWSVAAAAAGRPGVQPVRQPRPAERVIPHATEPWYCCAEPTESQLAVSLAVGGEAPCVPDPRSGARPATVPVLPADVTQDVRRAAFRRLLDGHEATVGYLAGRVQVSVAAAADAVDALVTARRAVTDADGRVIGVGGLSLAETNHRLRIADAAPLWCWCAWDAFGITAALQLTAEVSTTCGACGHPLAVELTRGQLPAARPEYGYLPPPAGSPLSCFCPYALLFCSQEHLGSWQAALPANVAEGGRALTVARYAAEARNAWAWAAGEEGPG
jgi:radical SAM superfamily enzyme YgiQ (UPF0313 family)